MNKNNTESIAIVVSIIALIAFCFYNDHLYREQKERNDELLLVNKPIYNVVKMPSGDIIYESTEKEFTNEQIVSIMGLYGNDWKDYSEENAQTIEFHCNNLACMILATNKKYILFSCIPPIPEN